MNNQLKHLHPNHDPPEITREETNVEKRRRRQPEQDRCQGIEDEQAQRVARQIAAHIPVPRSARKRRAVEDGRLHAHDDRCVQPQLAQHFVHGPFADEVFFRDVGEAVEGGAGEREEVAFYLVGAGLGVVGGAGDVVGAEQDAHAADAD